MASAHFLQQQGVDIALASYDGRMVAAARAMSLRVYELT
jgi:hypothetical protein